MSQSSNQGTWNDLSGLQAPTQSGIVTQDTAYLATPIQDPNLVSSSGQPWSQSTINRPRLDPHLDPSQDRGYQSEDFLSQLGHQPTTSTQPFSSTSGPQSSGQSLTDKGAQVMQQGVQKLEQMTQPSSTSYSGSGPSGPSLLDKGKQAVQQGMEKLGVGSQPTYQSGEPYSQGSYSSGPSMADKAKQTVQQGMEKLGVGSQPSYQPSYQTSNPLYQTSYQPSYQSEVPYSQGSYSTEPSMVDKAKQTVQQGIENLGISGQGSSSSTPSGLKSVVEQGAQKLGMTQQSEAHPLLKRTDDHELSYDQGSAEQQSPIEKLLNTFHMMDSLESGLTQAGETSIPSMKQALVTYEETIRNLLTIMENSDQGRRIVRHLTEMINIIQDYLEEFAPPTDSHAAQQWIHKLNLRLKRLDIAPTDGLAEVLTLLGLNEAMDRMETTPGLPIILSRVGRLMKILGVHKLSENQTKSILKDTADIASLATLPLSTALDESGKAIGSVQSQGGVKEVLKQLTTASSDPESIQDLVDTIKEWTLSLMTTVLPMVKIPITEGETPTVKYKVGRIDLSHVNITKDMVNVSVDSATGQIFTKVAGVDVHVTDLPWKVKHKKLKITSSGLADATTKDTTMSIGLGLNFNTQVPDVPAIVLTSPPCLKINSIGVHVSKSKLSPFANMFMGLFKSAIKKAIENRVEEEIERTMVENLDNLNIAIQKIAPRIRRMIELGRLFVFKGQETQKHIHEKSEEESYDFDSYQPGEGDEYEESEDWWNQEISQPQQMGTQAIPLSISAQPVHSQVLPGTLSDRFSSQQHEPQYNLYGDTFNPDLASLDPTLNPTPMVDTTLNPTPTLSPTLAPGVKTERAVESGGEHGLRQHAYRLQQQSEQERL